jgi:hypothetical protein
MPLIFEVKYRACNPYWTCSQRPGWEDSSIHDQESIRFMRQIIGAGDWVLNLLQKGLVFDWQSSLPTSYTEPNNKSATSNMESLLSTVADWREGSFICLQDTPPYCCNSMIVAVQYKAALNTTKYRPCIDLSRHVNLGNSPLHRELNDLSVPEELILT